MEQIGQIKIERVNQLTLNGTRDLPLRFTISISDLSGLIKTITVKSDQLTLVLDELNKLDGKGTYR